MSNMSYVRFENTARDLADCHQALEDMLNRDPTAKLSRYELPAAKSLVEKCRDILLLLAPGGDEDLIGEFDISDEIDQLQEGGIAAERAEAGEEDDDDDDEQEVVDDPESAHDLHADYFPGDVDQDDDSRKRFGSAK